MNSRFNKRSSWETGTILKALDIFPDSSDRERRIEAMTVLARHLLETDESILQALEASERTAPLTLAFWRQKVDESRLRLQQCEEALSAVRARRHPQD